MSSKTLLCAKRKTDRRSKTLRIPLPRERAKVENVELYGFFFCAQRFPSGFLFGASPQAFAVSAASISHLVFLVACDLRSANGGDPVSSSIDPVRILRIICGSQEWGFWPEKVLESEIQCAQEDAEGDQDEMTLPKNFPFSIIDNPGDQTIMLKRQYGSETIEVTVFMEVNEGEEGADQDKEEDDATGDEEESQNLSNISLVVTIDKGQGKTLEFCCSLGPDEVNIDSLTLKSPDVADDQSPYEGPEFTDLDEQLQKEFYTFLDRRGIKPSMAEFLQDFMIKKEEREYVAWLKNMKDFIEK